MLIDAEMPSEVSDTKGQILYDSTYMRYPELAEQRLSGTGMREEYRRGEEE